MAKILLTGAAGFIGSHLADHLLAHGHLVTGLDSFEPFYPEKTKRRNIEEAMKSANFQFIAGDIRDEALLKKTFNEFRPDLVIHLAARAGVRPSLQDPAGYIDSNVTGTAKLLKFAADHKTAKFIFASSSSVYGDTTTAPFKTTAGPLLPISPYGASKLGGEALCHSYSVSHDLDVTGLRFFTVYGPRQRPDLAIHKFMRKIAASEEIEMYGEGETARDYTFITDILAGIQGAIDLKAEAGFKIYNLGSTNPIRLSEMIAAIEEVTGFNAKIKKLPMQTGDVFATWADISDSQRDLNYNPQMVFKTGLQHFWDWFKKEQMEHY